MLGDELVGFAQQVTVDTTQFIVRHQTQADFVGNNDEVSWRCLHGRNQLVDFGHDLFFSFWVIELIVSQQVGNKQGKAVYDYYFGVSNVLS